MLHSNINDVTEKRRVIDNAASSIGQLWSMENPNK